MDLSKAITEPARRDMEQKIIGTWMTSAYYVKSKLLRERVEGLIKNYGHLIGIVSIEQITREILGVQVKGQGAMVTYHSGRKQAFTYRPEDFPQGSTSEVAHLINNIQAQLWYMMKERQKETNREMMH